MSTNEIDPMSLIMPGNPRTRQPVAAEDDQSSAAKKKKGKKAGGGKSDAASLLVVALKRLLPVGLNLFAGKEQELVQHCKDKFLSNCEEEDILEFCKNQITLPNKYDPSDELCWQHHLYSTLGSKQCASADSMKPEELDIYVARIVSMGKVLYGLHIVSTIIFTILNVNLCIYRLIIHLLVVERVLNPRLCQFKEREQSLPASDKPPSTLCLNTLQLTCSSELTEICGSTQKTLAKKSSLTI